MERASFRVAKREVNFPVPEDFLSNYCSDPSDYLNRSGKFWKQLFVETREFEDIRSLSISYLAMYGGVDSLSGNGAFYFATFRMTLACGASVALNDLPDCRSVCVHKSRIENGPVPPSSWVKSIETVFGALSRLKSATTVFGDEIVVGVAVLISSPIKRRRRFRKGGFLVRGWCRDGGSGVRGVRVRAARGDQGERYSADVRAGDR
jgi:hypothetical protein